MTDTNPVRARAEAAGLGYLFEQIDYAREDARAWSHAWLWISAARDGDTEAIDRERRAIQGALDRQRAIERSLSARIATLEAELNEATNTPETK